MMWLHQAADLPAQAKADSQGKDRYVIVYSPFGRQIFYNCLVPCYHCDPHMDRIAPGETRWTVSYFIFFRGDLKRFFLALREIHTNAKRTEGLLAEDSKTQSETPGT